MQTHLYGYSNLNEKEMIKCQHCGRQIPYDANVCPYCGRSIKQFEQKEVLDGEHLTDNTDYNEASVSDDRPPRPGNDRKMLFFIIAVLALLLVIGGIYHYTSIQSEDIEMESKPKVDSVRVDSIDLEQPAVKKVGYDAKKTQRVVVNGEGVRMRFGPSLKSDFLKDEKGATRSVKKGTQLECVGEQGDWYQVVYMGKRYYMSKQYTYLVE